MGRSFWNRGAFPLAIGAIAIAALAMGTASASLSNGGFKVKSFNNGDPSINAVFGGVAKGETGNPGTDPGNPGTDPGESDKAGIFEFTVSADCSTEELALNRMDFGNTDPDAKLTDPAGKAVELRSLGFMPVISTPGNWKVTGKFSKLQTSAPCLESVDKWADTDTVSMNGAFNGAKRLVYVAEPPSTVTDMGSAFQGATEFNQDISDWDMSRVTNTGQMFMKAEKFDQDISGWNMTGVASMNGMFTDAKAFNQPIGKWKVGKNTNDLSGMFWGATSFNQDLNEWDTSEVENMENMFFGASSFNGDISSWDTSNVLSMRAMFLDADNFNRNISGWKTPKVTNMEMMFASGFDQDLSDWDVSAVTEYTDFSPSLDSAKRPKFS